MNFHIIKLYKRVKVNDLVQN